MITTWVFPLFIEYRGGIDSINSHLKADGIEHEYTIQQVTAIMSLMPIFNILTALPLIYWYLCILKS